ncbi:MAG TPA: protein ImuA [Allosphingosinicella sp.]|nr:protein ImuA [Allosphingosinicella sp.]
MAASPSSLDALRAEIRAIERSAAPAAARPAVPFGLRAVDGRLAAGGLNPALHEAAAASLSAGDDAAATLFLAALAARFSRTGGQKGQVLWAMVRHDLFAPGLAQAGLTPDRLLCAQCRDDAELLAVMEEGVRHGSLAAVIGEVKRADMAATRRLQLAAEEGGTPAFLLRRWRRADAEPLAAPSAACTRWRIRCAPSSPLPFGIDPSEGLGRPRWRVGLVRQRGGPSYEWLLEAPDAEACFALPAAAGDGADRQSGAERRAA